MGQLGHAIPQAFSACAEARRCVGEQPQPLLQTPRPPSTQLGASSGEPLVLMFRELPLSPNF